MVLPSVIAYCTACPGLVKNRHLPHTDSHVKEKKNSTNDLFWTARGTVVATISVLILNWGFITIRYSWYSTTKNTNGTLSNETSWMMFRGRQTESIISLIDDA
jgi:hypothetical protein